MWVGHCNSNGYGVIQYKGKKYKAHRLAYRMWVDASMDDALVIHHTCNQRACVNPAHLQAVTQANNLAEMLDRRRYEKTIEELQDKVAILEEENFALKNMARSMRSRWSRVQSQL